jgi:hypothetical protein
VRDEGPRDYEMEQVLSHDRVIYVRDRSPSHSSRALAWAAGIGATLVTAAILFAASALWDMSQRLARLEARLETMDGPFTRDRRYRGEHE